MMSKVLVYLFQNNKVLAFRHRDYPYAGVQVPAGTIEPGEHPEQAALRELFEESGLKEVEFKKKVGIFTHFHTHKKQWHKRHVFIAESKNILPQKWTHIVSSGNDDKGLVLEYFWLPLEEKYILEEQQGAYLPVHF